MDWENDPDPVPSAAWDRPLGWSGKKRSGEELTSSFYIKSHCMTRCVWSTVKLISAASWVILPLRSRFFFFLDDCHVFVVRWRWALWRTPFTWWRIKPRSCGLWSASTSTGSTMATSIRSACASTASSTPLWMEASPDIRRYCCRAQGGGAACNNDDCHTAVVTLTFLFHPLQQAFFDKDYISSHPEDTERITHLKDLMQEQVWPGLIWIYLGNTVSLINIYF